MGLREQEEDIKSVLEKYNRLDSASRESLFNLFYRYPNVAFKSFVDELTFFGNVPEWRAREVAQAFFYPPLPKLPEPNIPNFDDILLSRIHEGQAKDMARLFAAILGMSESEYISTLPQFPNKPSTEHPGRRPFNDEVSAWQSASMYLGPRPLLIEGQRVPWREQAQLAGINIDAFSGIDLQGQTTPVEPYAVWVSIIEGGMRSGRMRPFPPTGWLDPGDRFGVISEAIAYRNAYSWVTSHTHGFIILPGPYQSTENPITPYLEHGEVASINYLKDPANFLQRPYYQTLVICGNQ